MKTDVYVVKSGTMYADGKCRWTARQSDAFRFTRAFAGVYRSADAAKVWAQAHARVLRNGARVVRLVPRKAKKR